MVDALDPDQMTVDERLHEAATMLAAGLRRLECRKQAKKTSNFRYLTNNPLDFTGQQSVDAGVSGDSENAHAR